MKDRKFTVKPSLWPDLNPAARSMRGNPTPAEELVWEQVRNRRFHGLKFRRQHPVDRFIVDFICPEKSVVVEIDGSIHLSTGPEDQAREKVLESHGLRVVRFTNDEVLNDLEGVLARLWENIQG